MRRAPRSTARRWLRPIVQLAVVLTAATGASVVSATSAAAATPTPGTIYIADERGSKVVSVAPDGTQSTVGGGFDHPTDVAVDAAGNVYVVNGSDIYAGYDEIDKITPDGTQTTLAQVRSAFALAFDPVGQLVVATLDGAVVKLAPDGTTSTVVTGLCSPHGVAVDPVGNIYVADACETRVVKIAPDGVESGVGTGLSGPLGVEVDIAGNVFVSDSGHHRIVRINSNGIQVAVASGFSHVWGLALDATGNLFASDNGFIDVGQIQKFAPDGAQSAVPISGLAGPMGLAVYLGPRQPQTITFPTLPDVTYGAADITPAATAESTFSIAYTTSTPTICTIRAGAVHVVGTGVCAVSADQPGDVTHFLPAEQVSRSFTIAKAPLTITPVPATGPYGTIPPVSPTYSGFQYGETSAVLDSPAACQANTTTTTVPSVYQNKSSCAGTVADDYSISYHLGTVTIVQAAVTLNTSATSAAASRAVGRMRFTTTAVNTASGGPIAGLAITVRVKINALYSVTCTATANASGVATCFSGNGNLALITYPHPYTASSPATTLYTAASVTGTIPK
ncbi:MAG: serine/threonine protein kinase, bacterial [Mycobacterium sp.]|nr:serine/threonine protein kinase, bacterial [Mycobacterium sp.]